ncbi:MAG: hypothetical protein WCC10_00170 [Tumebacillaceae bacterium]
MGKNIWSAGVLIAGLLSFSAAAVSSAEAPTVTQSVPQVPVEVMRAETQAPAIAAWLESVAQFAEFADWRGAKAVTMRRLNAPTGEQAAALWQVERDGRELGYLVTAPDGNALYEFSRRPVPTLPAAMQDKLVDNGYLYIGPMMHLAYLNGTDGLELYNMQNGETLPTGELLARMPGLAQETVADGTRIERDLPRSARPEEDALYALGLYGMKKGIVPLSALMERAENNSLNRPTYVVYDAVPDKLRIALAAERIIRQGDRVLIGVRDPFALQSQPLVYIDSRFPVSAAILQTSAVQ